MFLKFKKKLIQYHLFGFSFVELLISVLIILIIIGFSLFYIRNNIESARIANSIFRQNELIVVAEMYYQDMKFYPPDVNRGWDPGFVKPLPWNPDGISGNPGTNCNHCPVNWQEIISTNWNGPYLKTWDKHTPWGGKYDYNYWGIDTNRYGCSLDAGIYIGIQGDYDNRNQISQYAEQKMLDHKQDDDHCLNGEVQLQLEEF